MGPPPSDPAARPAPAGPAGDADSAGALPVLWQVPVRSAATGPIADPRLGADGGAAYASVAADVTAYDLGTGAVRWHTTELAGRPHAVPSDGSTVLFAADVVAALDAATGAVRWRATPPGFAGAAAPVQDSARVYVGTAAPNGGSPPVVVAYDRATGEVRWTAPVSRGWAFASGVRGLTLAPDGVLYVAASQCTIAQCATVVSWVIALDPATGAERWRLRVGDPADAAKATLFVEPLVAAGGLLLASDYRMNAALAIDPVRRRVAWRTAFRPGDAGPGDAPVDDSTGTVYVGSGDTYAYALDRATGAKRWELLVGGSISNLGRCGTGVVAQTLGMYALRRSDGRILGTAYDRGLERSASAVVSVGDRLVVGTSARVAVVRCP